jgi:putative protease
MPKKKAKKKTAKKKTAKKKKVAKKTLKKAVKKKAVKKKVAKKKVAKKAAKKAAKKKAAPKPKAAAKVPAKATMVAPGPQPTGIPSVEEPASQENAIGTVTHYYSHLTVAIVQINKGQLRVGDRVHIKGHTTDLTQTVESMEYEHQHVESASAGQSVGIKVKDHVREHDIVYLMK